MEFFFGRSPQLVDPDRALSGRSEPVLPNPRPHAVLGTPLTGPWREGQKRLLIGIGCFWGAEKMYWNMDGVESTSVGYGGGVTPNPTYREVCSGQTNHVELVEVVYDPNEISLKELVRAALEAHDPTQGFRQGNDVGTQYRSAFFTDSEDEAELIRGWVRDYGQSLIDAGFGPTTTEVRVGVDYYLAEDEHQQYLHKVPHGYCPIHSTGVACGI
ncbi:MULTISPECIES: peptide-methionine (S)-S-oxide reductase MsrA [unclassified Corynebacterium]|uniref:peptide-methionine (S)-S-oxide reductase MsrA n=1 Tax=unclassified Corynebacterium TaxID=2624378 RepID=UPI0021AA1930|nr:MULTISPECIES: peptide-methionine (S)-S-oxide reductase MsrA [unclassified Corynebacterium]MCT1453122.1 peptide-methionine (S)-S-oxide reductase MsrA [Corynebacterium sp. p3-SID1145]MCT1462233.1 peptide-methionine (S)-S-oxide reductase MsrA [Corynebacterium sp. p3-SID1140]MDN8595482.1 peptide-methionine (S)-S-oxide reductase MsrA [Corynebacterium sp. P4_F2]WKK55256.1 peptide-methionine (S)-S-oxide reductase MsrA [Corynebacterium sp. P4-C1]WKK62664.1 peptide-methionine (S)-S-oxide reductase M